MFTNLWKDAYRGNRPEKDTRGSNEASVHGHNLGHDPEKGDLEAGGNSDESLASDDLANPMSGRSDDAAYRTDGRADDEEPTTAEDVTEAAYQQEHNRLHQCVADAHPHDVRRGLGCGV